MRTVSASGSLLSTTGVAIRLVIPQQGLSSMYGPPLVHNNSSNYLSGFGQVSDSSYFSFPKVSASSFGQSGGSA